MVLCVPSGTLRPARATLDAGCCFENNGYIESLNLEQDRGKQAHAIRDPWANVAEVPDPEPESCQDD